MTRSADVPSRHDIGHARRSAERAVARGHRDGFTAEPGRGGKLAQNQEARQRDGTRPNLRSEREGQQTRVEARRLEYELAQPDTPLVQPERATPVVEVLGGEARKRQRVGVMDDGLGGEDDLEVPRAPAVAELPILRRRQRKGRVEATDLAEAIGPGPAFSPSKTRRIG